MRHTLPIPPNAPPRAALAAQIEHLIDILDALDAATEDLEPDADFEPRLAGSYTDRGQDLELADADTEPSLGSIDSRIDQRSWAAGGTQDLEHEHDGCEPDEADYEYSGGYGRTEEDAPPLVGPRWYGPAFEVRS